VVFCKPAALCALSSLQTLAVSFIPMPSLAALAQLPKLHSCVLKQAQPVSSSQCLALSRCRHVQELSLSSVQWADVPALAPLTGLTQLSLQVCVVCSEQAACGCGCMLICIVHKQQRARYTSSSRSSPCHCKSSTSPAAVCLQHQWLLPYVWCLHMHRPQHRGLW
jgi:hypothetical protein